MLLLEEATFPVIPICLVTVILESNCSLGASVLERKEKQGKEKKKEKKEQQTKAKQPNVIPGAMTSVITVGCKFLPKEGVGLRLLEIRGHSLMKDHLKTFSVYFNLRRLRITIPQSNAARSHCR